jgi:prepilin-type N-terminal cleavage/methylation domain-containing protein
MHAQLERRLGFTLIELLVVLAVLAVLAGGLFPALTKARAKRERIACVGNLKQIGLSFRIFAVGHNNWFPMAGWTNGNEPAGASALPAHYYRMMSNELSTAKILWCPSDTRKPATNWSGFSTANVSYFIGLEAQETFPQMLLAGDRNLTVNGTPVLPGLLGVTTNMALGWGADMHRHCGNIALGDGSVQQLTDTRSRSQVAQSGAGTNWLAVP